MCLKLPSISEWTVIAPGALQSHTHTERKSDYCVSPLVRPPSEKVCVHVQNNSVIISNWH